jgi:signal transduction histidine kinase
MTDTILLAMLVILIGGGLGGYGWHRIRAARQPLTDLQHLHDGIVVVNGTGAITQVNAQFTAYTGVQDAVGRAYLDVMTALQWQGNLREVSVSGRVLQPVESVLPGERGKIVVFRDVSRYASAFARMEERLERLKSLRQVHDEISESIEAGSVPLFALDAAHRLSGAQAGFLALHNEAGHMQAVAVIGSYNKAQVDAVLRSGGGIVGRVLRNGQAERVLDAKNDPDYNLVLPQTNALMIVPLLRGEDDLVGLILLATPFPERFTDDVFQLIRVLGNRIAASVENANLYQQTQQQLAELQQRHEQITHLEQLKTDMIRLAAHDLRNPLTDISLRLQLMELKLDDVEAVKLEIEGLQDATNRMRRIINDILSLERIEQVAQTSIANAAVVNLYEEVSLVVDAMQGDAVRKSIHMTFEARQQPAAHVLGEPTQLHEAIENLVGNAIKYTPDGGTVAVHLEAEAGELVFRVEDTGYGIPLDMQPRLFQPFFRVRTRETNAIEGTGLGLHLVKRIVERHNGEMIFHSEYRKGSTFGFRLPLAPNRNGHTENHPIV